MDALRALQLLTDLAYVALGIAAVAAALRAHERARVDVALLFSALGLTVLLQEIRILSCASAVGCITVPFSTQAQTILVLALPSALLRLLDDVADVPTWQMWVTLVLLIALSVVFAMSGDAPPGWLVGVLAIYIVMGTAYAAYAFARRGALATGITRRRLSAIAWGCGLIAATIVLGVAAGAFPREEPLLTPLARVAGLVSGLCFWAGFFPPNWLSQTWRLPELLGYLRPTRLMAVPADQQGIASDAMALERLCAATAATTGARRVFLILEDATRDDLYLWGAPLARIPRQMGSIGRVMQSGEPLVVPDVTPEQLPSAIVSVFATETLPRTAMLVPISIDGTHVGVLAAFAEKGPMFVEDDLEVVTFFAAEASAILQLQRYRQTANELEALREADKLKDEFMAVVSHELRTPLTAITGYADIMLRKLSGPLNERQERQVVGIRDAARRLLALINDLLDVSKLEAGTLDLHIARLDPTSVVERAVAAVRVIAATKGISVTIREPEADLLPVRADDERLQQVLSNLLINAIKFTPQTGVVWIGAQAEIGPQGPEVVFRVEDTGVGLTPGQAARVWERFYQAESSSTRRFGGAGLGLSIVRRLVELHGGRVHATSAGVDRGSTFAVHLPAATDGEVLPETLTLPARERPPVPIEVPEDAADRPLVLVVEDDHHIAVVLRTYLEADGYRVELARDGHEAVALARELLPFAITLDISLPKLDGWSVLNALKRETATATIPVVVVSIVDNRDFGLVLGATEYLVKPIDHERLRGVLHGLEGARQHGGGTVLVVDDDPALRDVLSSVLMDDGWRVATAADGDDALTAIARERPTAMVLDLMLPRVDGFQVLQRVRQQPDTRDLPIVIVTAKELTEEDRERLARGAERVVLKQALRIDDLREEVRAQLATYRQRRQGGHGP